MVVTVDGVGWMGGGWWWWWIEVVVVEDVGASDGWTAALDRRGRRRIASVDETSGRGGRVGGGMGRRVVE